MKGGKSIYMYVCVGEREKERERERERKKEEERTQVLYSSQSKSLFPPPPSSVLIQDILTHTKQYPQHMSAPPVNQKTQVGLQEI